MKTVLMVSREGGISLLDVGNYEPGAEIRIEEPVAAGGWFSGKRQWQVKERCFYRMTEHGQPDAIYEEC